MSTVLAAIGLFVLVGIAVWAAQPSSTTSTPPDATPPELPRLSAADTPWGVDALDLRPVTHTTIATSTKLEYAQNSVSYGGEDGRSFDGIQPTSSRRHEVDLRYRLEGSLRPGVLFTPADMDQKWAIFAHEDGIRFVRSWLREVVLIAEFEQDESELRIHTIRGQLLSEEDSTELVRRAVDDLIRTHVLQMSWPFEIGDEVPPGTEGQVMFNLYGNVAAFATREPLKRLPPERPLRSHSRLHIAVAQGDTERVTALLEAGWPADQRAGDGLGLLQWALARPDLEMVELLLRHGAPVDTPSDEGATPLMNAVQSDRPDAVRRLLEAGADPDAADHRGFTALHRGAEMGRAEIVGLLLDTGADPAVEALGHTPSSLAESQGHTAIVELLRAASR